MIRPQLLAIRVGDEHDSEDSSVLVDIAQVRVQILAPQIDFFELVVEDIDTFSLQRFGYGIDIHTFFAGKGQCDMKFFWHFDNLPY